MVVEPGLASLALVVEGTRAEPAGGVALLALEVVVPLGEVIPLSAIGYTKIFLPDKPFLTGLAFGFFGSSA